MLDNVAELVDDGMWGHDILEKTAEVAISRLEDGSLVAGAALELLTRLVERHSSLGGQLAEGLLMENVAKLEAQLEVGGLRGAQPLPSPKGGDAQSPMRSHMGFCVELRDLGGGEQLEIPTQTKPNPMQKASRRAGGGLHKSSLTG